MSVPFSNEIAVATYGNGLKFLRCAYFEEEAIEFESRRSEKVSS